MSQKMLSRAETVYEQIKDQIIYGRLEAGTLLNEGTLAAELHVSKTPVREALNRLKYEKLVEVVPYRGYFVSSLSVRELRDLIELRIILELSAAELAIQRANEAQVENLIALAKKGNVDMSSEEARKEFMKINADFHGYIAELSGNQQLIALAKQTIQSLQRVLFLDLNDTRLPTMKEEHLEIAQFIKERNDNKVKGAMLRHLQDSQFRILNLL